MLFPIVFLNWNRVRDGKTCTRSRPRCQDRHREQSRESEALRLQPGKMPYTLQQPVPPAAVVTNECLREMRKMRGLKVAVVRPPFLIDFPRRAHTRDEFGHEKSQPVILPTGCHADMRLCVSPQILYDNDCFGRSVKPAVTVRQSFFLQP